MTASWASIAKAPTPAAVAPPPAADEQADASVLVVDANAIINGVRLEGIADKAVTIQEVLDEVRDKQSRQYLASLPFGLQVLEPDEESLKIVTRFARETGDANVLSAVDLKVLALAHTMEVQKHGTAHLKEHPAQPLMKTKHRKQAEKLPGWGQVSNPEDWKVIDAIEGDGAKGNSRIAAKVQSLTLDETKAPAVASSSKGDAADAAGTSAAAPAVPSVTVPGVHKEGSSNQQDAQRQASAKQQQQQQASAKQQAPAKQQQQQTLTKHQGPKPEHAKQIPQQQQQQEQQQQKPQQKQQNKAAVQPQKQQQQGQQQEQDKEEAGDDEGWEMAASSSKAARRKRLKQYKREAKQAWLQQDGAGNAEAGQQQRQPQGQQQGQAAPVESSSTAEAVTPSAAEASAVEPTAPQAAAEPATSSQQEASTSGLGAANAEGAAAAGAAAAAAAAGAAAAAETVGAVNAAGTGTAPSAAAEAGTQEGGQFDDASSSGDTDGSEGSGDDSSEDGEGSASAGPDEYEEEEETESTEGTDGAGSSSQSSVACLTADFAMQNVLLQMGLRLLSPDGRRITRLSRWALRCSACFGVTREIGRIFCPKCGNMTMDRVELTIGADGAEYYGVKKRHILRGTRYSLPKPRGGRNPNEPILREDVFLIKTKAFGKRAQRKPKNEAADVGDDPFLVGAGETGPNAWYRSQQELAQHRGLAAVLQPAWKRNPNERKGETRSSRRG